MVQEHEDISISRSAEYLDSIARERPIDRRVFLRGVGVGVAGIAGIGILGACGTENEGSSGGKASNGSIKVASIAPTTGLLAKSWGTFGAPLKIATDEINAAGGILGRQVDLVDFDDQSNPSTEATITHKLLSEGIMLIAGPTGTSAALPSLEVSQRAGAVQGHWGADPALTKPSKYPRAYLVNQTSEQSARLSLTKLLKLSVKKPAILLADTGDGHAYTSTANTQLQRAGISAIRQDTFQQGATDLNVQVQKAKSAGADSLLLYGGTTADFANIFKAVNELGWEVPIAVNSSVVFDIKLVVPDLPQELLDRVYVTAYKTLTWNDSREIGARQSSLLQKMVADSSIVKSSIVPGIQGPFYDWMYLLKNAIERANSTDPTDVAAALDKTRGYSGMLGNITFTSKTHAGISDDQLTVATPADLTDSRSLGYFPKDVGIG